MTTMKKAAKGWLLTSLNLRLSLPLACLSDSSLSLRGWKEERPWERGHESLSTTKTPESRRHLPAD